jgi:hypothetical protein
MDDLLHVLDSQLEHTLAEIRRMEEALEAGELIVAGSKGQDVPNRLLAELRQHRMVLLRLIGVVGPAPEEPGGVDPIDELRQSWIVDRGHP